MYRRATSKSGYARAPAMEPALIARLTMSIVGAALLIIGAFLDWVGTASGVNLTIRAYYETAFSTNTSNFVQTVGFPMVVLGVVGLMGLGPRSGWLTRVVGGLGVAGFVLFAVQVYRAPLSLSPGVGAWLCLAGALLSLVGGSLGTRALAPSGPGGPA